MKRRIWWLYLVAGAGWMLLYYFGPPATRSGPAFNVFGATAFVAVPLGVALHKPKSKSPWILFTLGLGLFLFGDLVTYNPSLFYPSKTVSTIPFPSYGDFTYICVYPALMAGVLLLIHKRSPGKDRAALIDALIITLGIGVLLYVYVMAPAAHQHHTPFSTKLFSIAYPLGDLLLLGAMVRLAVGRGRRVGSFYLLMASAITLFVTDSIYGYIRVTGNYSGLTSALNVGWGAFYVLWGAAALHFSMAALEDPEVDRERLPNQRRLYILATASLMAPAVQAIQAVNGHDSNALIVAIASAVLFVLVLVRMKGLMVDVAEYKRSQKALQEAESKYRSLVEGLPAIVYIAELGKEGNWLYVSPQIEEILGFTSEDWIDGSPRLWQERLHPVDRDRAVREQTRQVTPGERLLSEYRLVSRDGGVVWIRDDAEVLADEKGNVVLVQGVMYDFSEQKRAESKLREALDREREAGQHLRKLDAMKNSFLEAVSHDLRTPLTNIMAGALTLDNDQMTLSPADSKDMVRRVAANARKLDRLLRDLLDLDRLSRGILSPNRKPTDLADVVNRVAREVDMAGHPLEIHAESLVAEVDPAQFERIVENLITNAVRYTPPGTQIWVRVEVHDHGALLTVEDAGPGIGAEQRQAIFEPFRQGSERVQHAPGVGIGLSLVARFAALHSGRAWVDERPGGGAAFKVYLPKEASIRAIAS